MHNEKIHLERIKRFIQRQKDGIYTKIHPVKAQYIKSDEPIPFSETEGAQWQEIEPGTVWNKVWGSGWFKVKGKAGKSIPIEKQGLYFDCDGEACVMKGGSPYMGLTPKVDWYHNAAKHFIPLKPFVDEQGNFELLIEAAANDLFGAAKEEYRLKECYLCAFEEERYQFAIDLELLNDLAVNMPGNPMRKAKILWGLNEICNIFAAKPDEAKKIAKELLAKPAYESTMQLYSVGHAHLDLAWLWPLRESRRKGGRSFANALRLMEMYPQYIFGASQAQLYQWMKEDYPRLYQEVKEAVKEGRWEVQGATWTEFDTNLPSGESLIRQFYYGKKFFKEEFGVEPNYLWLPDCFGFSGNLPQIIKGCGVDFFITQKLSWNETNVFDKHLFIWEGIDGSRVRAHQLPTNDYNSSNNPASFLIAEGRFEQAGIADGVLNLYGIGDGGGGPTRNHIEYGLRQRDLEGACKFRFSKAEDFFKYFDTIPEEKLPKAYAELYLEFHRGTYTTQARMKWDNYQSERLLGMVEWLAAMKGLQEGSYEYPNELHKIWEDTLLLQFHDILPGSSIGQVYEDAREMSQKNHDKLLGLAEELLLTEEREDTFTVVNPSAAYVRKWLKFPLEYKDREAYIGSLSLNYRELRDDGLYILVPLDPYSIKKIYFIDDFPMNAKRRELKAKNGIYTLNNSCLEVKLSTEGTVVGVRIWQVQFLAGESNQLLLWEDEPNNWGAWDINHYYRETIPVKPHKVEQVEAFRLNDYFRVVQRIYIGNSVILQKVELLPESYTLRIEHEVDWQEHHKMLRVQLNTNIFGQTARCGVQMGQISRSVRPKNAWEEARFDFPAHGFVALSKKNKTCAILSAGKYGYSARENSIELALLRSPADVDPKADIGKHNYSYAFSFEGGGLETAGLPIGAMEVDPLVFLKPGSPALEHYELRGDMDGVVIAGIKPSYDENSMIIRLYEPNGREAKMQISNEREIKSPYNRMHDDIIWVDFDLPDYDEDEIERIREFYDEIENESIEEIRPVIKELYKCDLLEKVIERLNVNEPILVRPFEILTLRLEFER